MSLTSTQSAPSLTDFNACMAKDLNAPTDSNSVGETAVSEDHVATEERHISCDKSYDLPKEFSRYAFAQKPIRHSTTNDLFQWPPPRSCSPPFRFDPFADSEEPLATHFIPAPVPKNFYVPPRRREWVPLKSADGRYINGIDVYRIADEPVNYPSPVARPKTSHREPLSTQWHAPQCPLAHCATPAVSQPSMAMAPSFYDDEDDFDFILHALRLPWLEPECNLINLEESTPPSTPSSFPLLSPSTLADEDEDLPVLEKEQALREWQEASPLACDSIYLTGW
ncbi:unnamed protein product [Somion occarium]|uniref:Uncharacterized protein n=1 Tax=Somion occarium TaxID=3059160 RepID=A0ABP1E233_9APHY